MSRVKRWATEIMGEDGFQEFLDNQNKGAKHYDDQN